VVAARALGGGSARVILRHVLPNAAAPIIVSAALGIGSVMLLEAGLSFLGIGVPSPKPSWGNMIADGQDRLAAAPLTSLFPSLPPLTPAPPGQSRPGSFTGLEGRNLLTLAPRELRAIRGNRIAMIFQEPMTSLNPVFTVGDQIAEAAIVHQGLSRRRARARA